jgi:acyl carrier protein
MIEHEEIRQTIVRLIQKQVDVPAATVLVDTPLRELHPEFDSLAMIELQLLLEKEYEIELTFGTNSTVDEFPNNVTELANQVAIQFKEFHSSNRH